MRGGWGGGGREGVGCGVYGRGKSWSWIWSWGWKGELLHCMSLAGDFGWMFELGTCIMWSMVEIATLVGKFGLSQENVRS